MTRMNASTHRVVEREGRHVAVNTRKPDRLRLVGKKIVSSAAGNETSAFERHFRLLTCGVILLWVCIRVFDFTLLPPAYKGLVITQPFDGPHCWDVFDRAWAARSHLKYGLDYTKGLRAVVVGDPAPLIPEYHVSHPPLDTWILALGMLIFGTHDSSVRLFELLFSVPCLLLTLLILRRLHGSACALLASLILVLLPLSGHSDFHPLMVLLALWAFYRYLFLTGRPDSEPAVQSRYRVELAAALLLLVQMHWVGIFYALALGLHYVLTCWRQRQVRWKILTVLALPSLLGLGLNFHVVSWGLQHNIALKSPSPDSTLFKEGEQDTPWKLMATLFGWPTRSGERSSFSWGDWQLRNLEFAQTNFTAPVLVFLAGYLFCLVIAPAYGLKRRLGAPRGAVAQTGPIKVAYPFRHIWFYLLPGLLFLLTFRGPVGQQARGGVTSGISNYYLTIGKTRGDGGELAH
jgi:4-amino-4-deoxy-L-arabinose transferase-like glycosyltransferase